MADCERCGQVTYNYAMHLYKTVTTKLCDTCLREWETSASTSLLNVTFVLHEYILHNAIYTRSDLRPEEILTLLERCREAEEIMINNILGWLKGGRSGEAVKAP